MDFMSMNHMAQRSIFLKIISVFENKYKLYVFIRKFIFQKYVYCK